VARLMAVCSCYPCRRTLLSQGAGGPRERRLLSNIMV
jgi:hypothetical protein